MTISIICLLCWSDIDNDNNYDDDDNDCENDGDDDINNYGDDDRIWWW